MDRIAYIVLVALAGVAQGACKPSSSSSSSGAGAPGAPPPAAQRPAITTAAAGQDPTGADAPTGSIGHNGLRPEVYQANLVAIGQAARVAIASAGRASPELGRIADPLLSAYAVSCAVPEATVTSPSPHAGYVDPAGLLRSTAGWATGGLDARAEADLHACLATRLNPSGADVEILLSGSQVNADRLDHRDYRLEEALWIGVERPPAPSAPPGAPRSYDLAVFPSPTLVAACGDPIAAPNAPDRSAAVKAALTSRVCGRGGACGLVVRDRAECAGPGVWTCPLTSGGASVPAIETHLRCRDWCAVYPGCLVPPACADTADTRCPAAP